MRINKFSLIVFSTLLLTSLQSLRLNLVTFGESAVVAQTPDARKAEADRLLEQGLQLGKTSQFEAALQSLQKALIIYREIKDRAGEGFTLTDIGLAYINLGEYIKARNSYQEALTIARQIKNRQGESVAIGGFGLAYLNLGENTKAIEYFQQSLAIAQEIKYHQGEGWALGNLGAAYLNVGDFSKAFKYSQQWLNTAQEIKDHQSEGIALGNLGLIYLNLGDYAKAIEYLQKQLPIARDIKDRQSEMRALGNLGLVYYYLVDYAKAISYYEQELAIAREIKDPVGFSWALAGLSSVYESGQDYTKVIEYSKQQLTITQKIKFRRGESWALLSLGLAYVDIGDYPKAIEYLKQSLVIAREIKDRQGEGGILGSLGIAHLNKGDYATGIEYSQQWLAISREIKDRQSEGRALNNLGIALYKSGNFRAAEKTLFEGVEIWESLRQGKLENSNKVSIFEIQKNTYSFLQKVLIAQNKTNYALEIAERGRARALVQLLQSRLSPNSKIEDNTPMLTVEEIKKVAKQQNATLVQYSIIPDEFRIQGKQEIQESEIYLWVIKPTGEVTFRSSDLKPLWQKENTTLNDLVTTSRDSIGVRGRGGGVIVSENPHAPKRQNQLKHLHELLIKPIADLLPSNENNRVIFIPQGALFLVPVAALQDANGKYLIQKHTILTAPSIQVLDLTHKQRLGSRESGVGSGGKALVVGNPTMPSVPPAPGKPPQQLPSLPGSEKEAQAIAPLLNTKAIIGSQGTKTAIVQKMPQARIIHLATHGILDDIRGLGSAIALAPDSSPPKPGEINGLLTAEEILDMKLQAELVVLSACDTGRGKITGDGVIGLSRSLISAGVPSVMVSLWSVPDSPTAELMSQFYTNLQQRHMDKAQALRQAMLTTMKTHPGPRDWAAFTLIGESE
ncbi:MAG: CHAT domain-containing protein [Stigonema ocellatum SAG 48.90 = DSM 106950]|nr:CHAT domain-containing protein [Stigonema ocellatum SAG 48.90 = DSM 106950]